jgi:hypothetical protein
MKYLASILVIIFFLQPKTLLGMYEAENAYNDPTKINTDNIHQMYMLNKTICDELPKDNIEELIFSIDIPRSDKDKINNDPKELILYLLEKEKLTIPRLKELLQYINRMDLTNQINKPQSENEKLDLDPRRTGYPTDPTNSLDMNFLRTIAQDLGKDDIKQILFVYTALIPKQKKEEINNDGMELFKHFKEKNYLGEYFLANMLACIKRIDLKEKLLRRPINQPTGQPSEHNLNVPPSAVPSHSNAPRVNELPPTYDESQAQYGQQANNSNTAGEPYVKCVGFRP